MEKTNREIQNERKIRYFVEAAWKIEDTEGVEAVTARKVADLAGYNVATLYNYFDNLDHLIAFASLRHLGKYAKALPEYTKGITNPLTLYMRTWVCFSYHAFQEPAIYKNLFFGKFVSSYNDSLKMFYEIFPDQLPEDGLRFYPMLQERELHKRDYTLLMESAKCGYIPEDKVMDISNMNVLIWRGILDRLSEPGIEYSVDEMTKTITSYHAHTLISFGVPREELEEFLVN